MRTLASILAAVMLVMTTSADPAIAQQRLADVDSYIETTRLAWNIPGLAVAVVSGDSVVYSKGFGRREAGKTAPIDDRTLFQVGSTTKAFTAAAIGLLVDEGKVAWDDAVTQHLTWFQLADPWLTRRVTIRDLLAHRVGVFASPAWVSNLDPLDVIRRARFSQAAAPFRDRPVYSNLMYAVAGQVAGQVSGMSWGDLVRERVFQPLGMTSSFTTPYAVWDSTQVTSCFSCDLAPGTKTGIEYARFGNNVAMPHVRSGALPDDGSVVFTGGSAMDWRPGDVARPIPWQSYDNAASAGAIVSNLVDMTKWLRLQMGKGAFEGRRLLRAETVEEMHALQILERPTGLLGLMSTGGGGSNLSGYGLGWHTIDYQGHRVVWHGGAIYGFYAYLAMIPDQKLGVVILANRQTGYGGHGAVFATALHIFDDYLGTPRRDWNGTFMAEARRQLDENVAKETELQRARKTATRPSLALDDYTGTYVDEFRVLVTVTEENGSLFLRYPDAFRGRLEHWHHDVFRMTWGGVSGIRTFATFTIGPTGLVEQLEDQALGTLRRIRKSVPKD